MPILKDFRKTTEVSLPSYPDSKIVVYDSLLVGEMGDLKFDGNTVEQALSWLPKLIKEWNFTNENKEILPINAESLKLLRADDLQVLMESIKVLQKESKKD